MTTRETEWLAWVATRAALSGIPRLLTVCAETQRAPAYRHLGAKRRRETHSIFKITLSGEGVYKDAAGERRVGPGFGFLCKVSDPATGYRYPADATEPWRFIYMAFEGADDLMRAIIARHGSVLPAPQGIVRRLQHFKRGREATTIVGAMEGAKFVYDILSAAGEAAEQREEARHPASERMRRIRELMLTDARNIPTVAALAHREGISREHLSRLFQEYAGQPVREFLAQARLREACADLKETTLEIKEIAARFGYSSQSHFTRAFVKLTGLTPCAFRESGTVPPHGRNLHGDARKTLGPDIAVP